MSLIHFLVSFSFLISVMRHDVGCGRAKVTLMTLIRRLKETKKCIRDMPAPVSGAYVSRCLLAVSLPVTSTHGLKLKTRPLYCVIKPHDIQI